MVALDPAVTACVKILPSTDCKTDERARQLHFIYPVGVAGYNRILRSSESIVHDSASNIWHLFHQVEEFYINGSRWEIDKRMKPVWRTYAIVNM
jgi:hypothetical protein